MYCDYVFTQEELREERGRERVRETGREWERRKGWREERGMRRREEERKEEEGGGEGENGGREGRRVAVIAREMHYEDELTGRSERDASGEPHGER